MPAYDVSYFPEYKRLVTGGEDTDYYRFYHRRRGPLLRATSALPEIGRETRERSLVPLTDPVTRSLSVARDIINEPPPVNSIAYAQFYDTKDAIERSQRAVDKMDNYWLTKAERAVQYPEPVTYVSPRGNVYRILSPTRKRFPSEYWAQYPYSSTIAPLYSFGKSTWNYFDPIYDNYVRSDIGWPYEPSRYYRSAYYVSPGPKPDRLSSLEYRPSYVTYSRAREGSSYAASPAYYRRMYY